MSETKLTHVDGGGAAQMVDVGEKPISRRTACALAICAMQAETADAIRANLSKKGDVLQVARIAAISAVKRTDELIPLCHSLSMDKVEVEFSWPTDQRLQIRVCCNTTGRTGVEMEALVGASIGALTVYDMCKAIDRSMSVEQVVLESKTGGTRGDFVRAKEDL